ncbi:MAG: FliA/WhiG family RNA polymerase sigma factor [Oligoflexia bacterium]|nr:FliA/WhiG family RNA polymerase sigma factor [Oligoflexia bacterium]
MRLNQGIQKYRESERNGGGKEKSAATPASTPRTPAKSTPKATSKSKKGEPTELERLEAAVEAVKEAEEAAREEAAIQKEIADELAREQAQTDKLVRGDISPVNAPRERLVTEYAPLIKYIAQKIAARLPANIELDDLISSGVIGLMDAIEKYDANRDNKFKTYAEFRIRGAILDELRAQDWVPRSVREKAKVLERCYAKIEQQKGRQATDEEVCTELGVTPEEFHDLLNQVRSVSLLSYDDISNFSKADKRSLHGYGEAGSRAPTPFSEVNVASIKRLIAQAIQDLPEKQRLVLSLYYYEDLNLKEIGRVLDVTESRVSQLHTQAVLRLKARLRNHWDEFVTVFG